VHCPGCGADNPVPEGPADQVCFTCHIDWFRHELTGDAAADHAAIAARVGDREWLATWRPLLVDVPDGAGGKTTKPLDCAFVYLPG